MFRRYLAAMIAIVMCVSGVSAEELFTSGNEGSSEEGIAEFEETSDTVDEVTADTFEEDLFSPMQR
ncbi:MAG: hypothetical protein IJ899_05080 [Blautia sp.]|nr:hypothetical protein [Blautia sp.]